MIFPAMLSYTLFRQILVFNAWNESRRYVDNAIGVVQFFTILLVQGQFHLRQLSESDNVVPQRRSICKILLRTPLNLLFLTPFIMIPSTVYGIIYLLCVTLLWMLVPYLKCKRAGKSIGYISKFTAITEYSTGLSTTSAVALGYRRMLAASSGSLFQIIGFGTSAALGNVQVEEAIAW